MLNYIIGDFVSRLKNALSGHLKTIKVLNTKILIELVDILYKNGLINSYIIRFDYILIYLKYKRNISIISNIKLITSPSKKVYWSLNKLSLKQNKLYINEFYIISTSKGLLLSNDCILDKKICGKVLFKIYV